LLNCLQRVAVATHDAPRIQRAHVSGPPQKAFGQRTPLRPTLSLLRQQASNVQVRQHLGQSLRGQQHVAQIILLELRVTAHQLRQAPRTKLSSQVEHQPTKSKAQLT